MSSVLLIFPNQLYLKHPGYDPKIPALLVEHDRYFKDFAFHKQKLILQRASMKAYAKSLKNAEYLERCSTKALLSHCRKKKYDTLVFADPVDKKLEAELTTGNFNLEILETPAFLNTTEQLEGYFKGKKAYFFTKFYIQMRKEHDILIKDGKPIGGKWSFDPENRKKLPKGIAIPKRPTFLMGRS